MATFVVRFPAEQPQRSRTIRQRVAVIGIALGLSLLAFGTLAETAGTPAFENARLAPAIAAVVRINATASGDPRSTQTFGTARDGSGVVIDSSGLVLTIGYLIVDADSVTITLADGREIPAVPVAYDHDSGFGLVRALRPIDVKPVELGSSTSIKPRDSALAASWGGKDMAIPTMVMARSTFIGFWEYMLENAIFTAPPHPAFSGAALFTPDGKLVGIGSLTVIDGTDASRQMPCNMFVPVERLKPILADLLERGRAAGPRHPWIGLASEEVHGRLLVTGVAAEGPAAAAGIQPGDMVLGVGGNAVTSLEQFYKALWGVGEAGATVPLDVLRGTAVVRIDVRSADRHDFLRLSRSY